MIETRDATLDRLRQAAEKSRNGHAGALLIRGTVGVGKSWVLERAVDMLGGVTLLRATGHPAETDLPFAGLHQLISPLVPSLDRLPVSQARALATALALEPGGPTPQDSLAVSAGLLGLVTLEAETRPVAIVVDDLQWMDPSTRRALTFVARRIEADAVLMLSAARSDEFDDANSGGFDIIDLEPLSDASSRKLLGDRFPNLSAGVRERILDVAGGLPLALTHVAAGLSDAQRRGEQPLPLSLSMGERLDGFYASRLGALSDEGRRALATVALEHLTRRQVDAALARLGSTIDVIRPAERAGLIRQVGDGYEFSHPTARSAALGSVSSSELRTVREAVVGALPPGSPRAATHLDELATGPDAATAAALENAAEDAWRRSAYQESGRLWRASAGRSDDPALQTARRARAVQAFAQCAAWSDVVPLTDLLVRGAATQTERLHWLALASIAELYADAPLGNTTRWEALDVDATTSRDAVARALTTQAFVLHMNGEFRGAVELADHVRRVLAGHAFTLSESLVLDDIDVVVGRPGAGKVMASDWAASIDDDELCDPSKPFGPIVAHMIWMGHVDDASRIVDRSYEALQSRGSVGVLDLIVAQRALVLAARGRWDEADADYSSATTLSRAMDFAASLPHIALRHAYLLAARGDEARVLSILEEMETLPSATRPIHQHLILCTRGLLELTLGRAESAATILSTAAELEDEMGVRDFTFTSRAPDLFDALWRLRREDEARAVLDEFAGRAATAGRAGELASAARCRGLVAGADEVDAVFEAALDHHRSAPNVFETARTELAWGSRLRRSRRKADARAPLHRAFTRFEQLGAAPWASATLSELAATGERHARQHDAGAARRLTPRELEVALAVSRGASNAEAAARLFVSKRTVEYHLAGVYRKLGVTGRAELTRALEH